MGAKNNIGKWNDRKNLFDLQYCLYITKKNKKKYDIIDAAALLRNARQFHCPVPCTASDETSFIEIKVKCNHTTYKIY